MLIIIIVNVVTWGVTDVEQLKGVFTRSIYIYIECTAGFMGKLELGLANESLVRNERMVTVAAILSKKPDAL